MIAAILILAALAGAPQGSTADMPLSDSDAAHAGEQLNRSKLATILRICREARGAPNLEAFMARLANEKGYSTYTRQMLMLNCSVYREGQKDGSTIKGPASR